MNSKARELSERFLEFGVSIVKLCRKLPKGTVEQEITRQLFRSGTSIGANYEEACGAESHADFVHKLRIAYKESRESVYWLKLIDRSEIMSENMVSPLIAEAESIARILGKSLVTLGKSKGKPKTQSKNHPNQ